MSNNKTWHLNQKISDKWTVLGQTKKIFFFFIVTKSFILIKISYILEFFYISKSNPGNKKFKKCSHKAQQGKINCPCYSPIVIYYTLYNNFFYTRLAYALFIGKKFIMLPITLMLFFFFSFSKILMSFLGFFCLLFFFRNFLIYFTYIFLEFFFVFLIIFICYFYIQKKKIIKNVFLVFLYPLNIM